MYRLIAIDLDDTLLGNDLTISQANYDAVAAAREYGLQIVLATARGWYSTEPYVAELQLKGYTVCGSGTRIYDHLGECVKAWRIPLAAAKHILRVAEQEGIMVTCSLDRHNVMNFVRDDWRDKVRPGIDVEVPHLAERLAEAPTQLFIKGTWEVNRLLELLPSLTDDYRIHTVTYRDNIPEMMILHPEANKAAGLSWVCQQWGIKQEEVMALGDSANDSVMLRWAGLGVAMGWSPDDVKAAADYVTDEDDWDGVATAIRRFVLPE